MTAPAKRKGDKAEREIVDLLYGPYDLDVRRRFGAGQAADSGDLILGPHFVAQVKSWADFGRACIDAADGAIAAEFTRIGGLGSLPVTVEGLVRHDGWVLERLEGHLFVAHNARFDYGFLRTEFRRLGLRFSAPVLCTVKLSRALYAEHRRHNLDTLMERFSLACGARHRALGFRHGTG
jgi:hypothetical protein